MSISKVDLEKIMVFIEQLCIEQTHLKKKKYFCHPEIQAGICACIENREVLNWFPQNLQAHISRTYSFYEGNPIVFNDSTKQRLIYVFFFFFLLRISSLLPCHIIFKSFTLYLLIPWKRCQFYISCFQNLQNSSQYYELSYM